MSTAPSPTSAPIPGSPGGTRTVVLDDDPTGTQSVSGVPVLLQRDGAAMTGLLRRSAAVFVLTNTRAMSEADARGLLEGLRADVAQAEQELGQPILVVLRGDSTLRGHVFAEIDVFAEPGSAVVFVPAFPAGGRRTVGGVHEVLIDSEWRNAADTEFAKDPVFGYESRSLVDYVREKGSRDARSLAADELAEALRSPSPGVLVPDVRDDADLRVIARAIEAALDSGVAVTVRSAAPLAALLAGAQSDCYLDLGVRDGGTGPVLVVAGSHTGATTEQLERLWESRPDRVEISAEDAVRDPAAAGAAAGAQLRLLLASAPVVTLSTARVRSGRHGTLEDGARVMRALTTAVAAVADLPGAVIAKGGITSAEVARTALGAATGRVIGQVEAGVSLWALRLPTRDLDYIVVPGNMGRTATLVELADKLVNR